MSTQFVDDCLLNFEFNFNCFSRNLTRGGIASPSDEANDALLSAKTSNTALFFNRYVDFR